MRKGFALLLLISFALLGFYSCKSVETTSAMIHNDTGNYEKAIEMAIIALEKNPNDAEAHYQLGFAYSNTGKMREAYDEFKAAARLDPKNKLKVSEEAIKHNWAKHYNNGLSLYSAESIESAAKEFEKATESDPREVKGWLNLARVYYTLARNDTIYLEQTYAVVDTLMARATPEEEEYGSALAISGKVMVRRGMEDKAVEIFDKLLLDDPLNFEIVEDVGNNFLGSSDWEGASKFLDMAAKARMKADAEDFELYYNLGIVYLKLEKYIEAIDAYQSALRLMPDNKIASYSLLLAYYQSELYDEGVMLGEQYTATVAPDDPRGWQVLSLIYNKKGMKIKAEEAYKRFQELSEGGTAP